MNKKITNYLFLVVILAVCSCYSSVYAGTPIKMLAIGNSFSEDALEAYVGDLAKADGVEVVIGNLYWGGCDLVTHWNNASTNNSGYSYRKIVVSATGVITKTTRENTSIQYAVIDDNWDYIAFQQVSQHSGKFSTFFPYLTNLKQYVNNLKTNPNVKYMLHRTWAYTSNSTHSEYEYYRNNQRIMYDSIINAYDKAAARTGIDIIIPTGTAIQNARSSYIGDNLNRDGYHLTYGLGRYTAACAWYEKVVGRPVIGNTFRPSDVTAYQANLAQNAAHYAVTTPTSITSMASYVGPPAIVPATLTADVNIDFGDQLTTLAGWNNLASIGTGSSVASLKDATGKATAISITVTKGFNAINAYGPTVTTTISPLTLPASAAQDFFYSNGLGTWNNLQVPESDLLIAGLYPGQPYDLYIFASRLGVADIRDGSYAISGDRDTTLVLDASNNSTNLASVKKIQSHTDGTIGINITKGPHNTNQYGFFYINTLVIRPSVVSSTAVQNVTASNFKFYPNPVKSSANIEANENLNIVTVYDLLGKKVLEQNKIMSKKITLDLSSLNDGCYVIKHNNECIRFVKTANCN